MSITTTAVPAPASRREQNAIQHDIEALEDPRSERSAGKGRRRRAAAEQRRIEQQRWGQYLIDNQDRGQYLNDNEDGDITVVAPSRASNRRRARRSSRRNSARDDLEKYLDGLADGVSETALSSHPNDLELDVALALSLSLSDSGAVGVNGRTQAPFITDMTYESLVQLEDVRCVASSALVNSLPVYTFVKQEPVGPDQTLEVCVICQGKYEDDEMLLKLPCRHEFHQTCGAKWLLDYSKLCPVCKHDVTEEATESSSFV
ncbi:hypothetical protein BDL97_15G025300 [Sphagnum fallax]|jgi:hypothetical protein|uniref:Uncharacterized protein n=2 Tax=Sphagnum jensenii TaxID=128206 RepID=A0ABP0W777_9BRYO|nr:hypothetical protein BDL97_15G025300 [Sphagnum fallax]